MARSKTIYGKKRKEYQNYLKKQNSNKTSSNDMSKKISNYETRLKGSNIDVNEIKDTRNPVEKFLNLQEDQNVLFDIFEVLGRPQQALFRGIENMQEGGSFLQGAKEGITGEEYTYAGDILRNMGVSDEKLFTNHITKEDTSLADILGFGADILADPIDLTIAGTGKSILENAVGATAKGVKKGAGIADNLVTKAIGKADDVSYYNKIRQLGVDNGLIDISKAKKLSKVDLDNVAGQLTKKGINLDLFSNNLGDLYVGAKKGIARTADYAKSIPNNLYNKINRVDNALDATVLEGNRLISSIENQATDYATKVGANMEDVLDDINTLISSKYAPEITGTKFLNDVLKNGKATITGTEKEISKFIKDFKKLNKGDSLVDDVLKFKVSSDGTEVTLKRTKGLDNIVNNNANRPILDNIRYAKKEKLSPEVQSKVNELTAMYKKGARKGAKGIEAEFKNLVDNSEQSYQAINSLIKEATGQDISFQDMIREGYTRNALTDDGNFVFKEAKSRKLGLQKDNLNIGSKATTSGKKYSNIAQEAEYQLKKDIKQRIARTEKAIENKKLRSYENRVETLTKNIEADKASLRDLKKSYNENIDKLNLSKAEKESNIKSIKQQLDDLDVTVKDTIKKSKLIVNDELPTRFIDRANKYTDSLEKLSRIQDKLSSPNLTKAKVSKYYDEYKKVQAEVLSNQQKLYFEKARIDGAILKKQTKNIDKAVNTSIRSSSKYTKQLLDNEKKFKALTKKLKSVDEGYNKIAINLEKKINGYNLELDKLKNMTPDEIIKYNERNAKEISKLQGDLDFYKSAEGVQFYETSFTKGLGDFINMTAKDAKDLNRYNEILLHSGLNDESILKFVPKGEKAGKIPAGYSKLDAEEANKMVSFLNNKSNFLPESQNLIKDFETKLANSSSVIIDKDLKSMLKLNIKENEVKPLVKMIDGFNNTFKKYKVFTPGFHLRNISGNATNMIMSGVPISKIPGLYKDANRLVDNKYIVDLFSKKVAGNLTAVEEADLKMINKFMQGGFLGKGKEIQDLAEVVDKASKNINKTQLGKLVDKIFTGNMNLNEWVDNRNRMALMLFADKNPKYLSKIGASDAIDAVKKVLFDPNNLSPFEKNTLKRIVPFYTFTKQNLMFHADNIMKNTSRYKRLVKTFDETYDALPEDSYRTYQKENMQIPLGLDDNGNLTTLKSNLPVSDLGEYISNPLQRLVSSTSPLIKAPFEAVTGVDTFTGQELYKPGPSQLASWLGIDAITTAQFDKVSDLLEDIENNASIPDYMADLLPSVMQYSDSEKIANQKQYEELLQYQQIVKDLKNQGIDVPTIKDLTNSTNSTLRSLKQRRDKLQKRRS